MLPVVRGYSQAANQDRRLSLLPIPLTPMSYMIGITHRALVPPSPAARVLLGQLKSVAAELQDAVREADELVAAQRPGAAADR